MTFTGCGACGMDPIENCICDELKVSDESRKRAHELVDQWLGDCERRAYHCAITGRFGHVGTFTLRATSDDEAVELECESSIVEDL